MHQRRGYGEVMLRHALEEEQRATGLRMSVLQATEAGRSLYQRLGFRRVTSIRVYVRD
jgi:ribosomal protein S18 acetylase RimI-like enzyme